MDPHLNEHRVGPKKIGPAQKLPTFDRTKRGSLNLRGGEMHIHLKERRVRVWPRNFGPGQKVPYLDRIITAH